MFELKVKKNSNITIIHFHGSMCIQNAIALRDGLEDIFINSKAKEIALDLIDVQSVDSSGLGIIVWALAACRVRGQRLLLYRPNHNFFIFLEELELTGFFPTLEESDDLMGRSPNISFYT